MAVGLSLAALWARVKNELVGDVPSNLAGCEVCREVDCTQSRWRTCSKRLAAEAEWFAEDGAAAPQVAESGEMSEISADVVPQVAVAESLTSESDGKLRSIASSK